MSQIEKVKVMDARIVQPQPRYAVNEGAVSISNTPFQAATASSSSVSFNITAPSQNMFMDRNLPVSVDIMGKITATLTRDAGNGAFPAALRGVPVFTPGDSIAPAAYPFQSCMSTTTATINNSTVSVNSQDVIYEILKMSASKRNHKSRTTPSMLDKYVSYNDSRTLSNSVLKGYQEALNNDNVPNGAFQGFQWVKENGAPADPEDYLWALPQTDPGPPPVPALPADNTSWTKTVYFKLTVTENLILSPFIFNESQESVVGLYGLNNIKLMFNVGDVSRMLRYTTNHTTQAGYTFSYSPVSLNGQNPFQNAVVNCVFRSPSLSLPLPKRSIVPYMEYPRYISTSSATVAPGANVNLRSQTITLSQIPDLLVIYAKPSLTGNNNIGDYYLPIQDIRLNFNNVAGILSSMTTEQLFHMSQNNGLDVDYNEYLGHAWTGQNGNGKIGLSGSFLVLRPGVDFALPAGVASGVGGTYSMQFDVNCVNNSGETANNPILYTMAVNSGFFVSENGTSAVTTAPITEPDVIEAPVSGDTMSLTRYIGGSNFWKKLNSGLKSIVNNDAYKAVSKLGKSALRDVGMEGKVAADVLDKLGLGINTGGGKNTGGRRRTKNNLHNLLS